MDKTTVLSHLDFKDFYRAYLPSLKENGKAEVVALCPFHPDRTTPNLSVNLETGLYHCFACGVGGDSIDFLRKLKGLDFKTALAEMGRMAGIETCPGDGHGKVVASFEYKDAGGKTLNIKERVEPGRNGRGKEFVFKHLEGSRWVTGRGCEPVPYNLPALVKATYAIVVEGEGKTELLKKWGLTATSFDSGASSPWRQEYLPYFEGKKIAILPDNDTPGREYAQRIAAALHGRVRELKITELPDLGEAEDIIDWQKKGGTKEKLLELIKQAPTWSPPPVESTVQKEESGLNTLNALNTYTSPWPTLKPETLYGLAGEMVKMIEPHSEADPVALLVNFLSAFGNVIGDKPHFVADGAKHSLKINAVFVGETSKGRKGTAWERSRKLLGAVEEGWTKDCIVSGLSSGEGLIWAVRDPIFKKEPVKEKGRIVGYQELCVDGGAEDKRLLVLESEFSSVLKVLSREGNTLSAIIRQAWDGSNLRTLTKNSPVKATGTHVSLLGHITKDELLRYLDSTEVGNGFGNRFLWLCVRRSKCLPEGGGQVNLNPLVVRLKQAIDLTKGVDGIERDGEAREVWHAVYPTLSDGKPGLFGALTSRAEAYVMRLACIYALLDCSPTIKRVHLEASLALWDYVEESVRYIFGNASGDYAADRILQALRQNPEGISRSDIYKGLFGCNVKGGRLDRATELLISSGKVGIERQETGEKGRPREILRARGSTY